MVSERERGRGGVKICEFVINPDDVYNCFEIIDNIECSLLSFDDRIAAWRQRGAVALWGTVARSLRLSPGLAVCVILLL